MTAAIVRLDPHQRAQISAAAYVRQRQDAKRRQAALRVEKTKSVWAFVAYTALVLLAAAIARHQLIASVASHPKSQEQQVGLALYANPTAVLDRQIALAER